MKNKLIALVALTVMISFSNGINCYAVYGMASTQSTSIKFVPPVNSNLFGAEAAKADTELTLEDMLTYAIQDEYLAKSRYSLVIEKFGEQRPFSNIVSAEVTHINHLTPLFKKYNITLPPDNSKDYVKIPTSIKESLETGAQGEIENIAMYEISLKQTIPNDVKTVFTLLRNASQNHLQAFKRALQFY